jgi:nickel/cobalt transporter (NicO) family protein
VVDKQQTMQRRLAMSVVLVSVLLFGLNASGLQINAWSNQLESVSYALIALVGLYLLATQLLKLWRSWRGAPLAFASVGDSHHSHAALERHDRSHHVHDHEHDHSHAHDHYHEHTHADGHEHDHHHHGHSHHGHHHAPGGACNHIVDARQLAGPMSWRKMMAVVLSVGIRPCTGAILVLVFAVTQGLFWAGVAATFAMAFGTAITVAVLATFALGGAIVIFLFGALLFAASLGPARPF